jgi:TrmH family RNA methyltransferase
MKNNNSLIRIESSENRIIKLVKSLNRKKFRDKEGLFFVEGVKFAEEAIMSSWEVRAILLSDSFMNCLDGTDGIITYSNSDKYLLPDKLFAEISDTKNPQGLMAVVKQKEHSLSQTFVGSNLFIILDGIQDPGNMGTIIRTADSAAFNAVILSKGCVDIYNPKVVRSTAGSLFHIPCVYSDDLVKTMTILGSKGIKTLSAIMSAQHSCYDVKLNENVAIAIGNEANGISSEVLDNSSDLVSIPIIGNAESLNASVAAGILMYESVRQRLNN